MSRDLLTPRRRATLALVVTGGIFTAVAVFALAAHPASQERCAPTRSTY
jgi:hypothetical protein